MSVDRFTGKRVDRTSDLLPRATVQRCEDCDSGLINNCLVCGAPVCCPKCCAETMRYFAEVKP